jgi:hypothetical protein
MEAMKKAADSALPYSVSDLGVSIYDIPGEKVKPRNGDRYEDANESSIHTASTRLLHFEVAS